MMPVYPYRLTKRQLKRDAPAWAWFAERAGFGWRYVGRKDGALVVVSAFAVMSGPAEDDYSTQWRVDDGRINQDYSTWIMKTGRHG
jgi:hypothetical protein